MHNLSLETHHSSQQDNVVITGLAAQKFGILNLHPWQMRIIEATVKRRDSLVVSSQLELERAFAILSLHYTTGKLLLLFPLPLV